MNDVRGTVYAGNKLGNGCTVYQFWRIPSVFLYYFETRTT